MMNQPQQAVNPLAPELSPTAEQMLNAYREKAAAIRGETAQAIPQSFNPYQDQSQEDQQGQHVSKMQEWVSPVKMDAFDVNKEYTDDTHDNFLQNLEEDPAVQEYGEQFHAYLETLMQAVKAGQISPEDAQAAGQNYLDNVVKPIISKHHSKTGKDKSLHRKREPEIPDIVKKVRGSK
ncbi:hypothetical protein B9R80_002411 [Salmonella enterica]|nr:hypothetical protein [Salmonella enterica]